MKNSYLRRVGKLFAVFLTVMLSTQLSRAQLSGNKTVGIDYPSIAAFVTDVNAQGVLTGGGGVTLFVPAGYSETAPIGGYAITATGTAAENITIVGSGAPQPIITANSGLTVGSLNDAIFKIIGGDYINIANLDMRENAANTTTAAATNNMTEFGVALFYGSTTNGAQRNSVINNTITLNKTYTNTFAVYSSVRHDAVTMTTTADITAPSGANSNNKVYGNIISNVNYAVVFIGSATAANQDSGNDVGGTGVSTGNVITNWGTAAAASAYPNLTGSNYAIFLNHQLNPNISYNTITSAVHASTNVIGGILNTFSSTAPTLASIATINNNTITLSKSATSGGVTGILNSGATVVVAGSSLTINNNAFINSTVSGVTSSSAITAIQNQSAYQDITISTNTVYGNTSTATTGGFSGISNTGTFTGTANIQNNTIGTGASNAITYSVASSGAITAIANTGASAGGTLNITGNDIRGIVHSVTSSGSQGYILNSGVVLNLNVTNNSFTNLAPNTTATTTLISMSYSAIATGTKTVSNNSIVTALTKTGATGNVLLITDNGSTVSGAVTTIQNNNFSNISVAGTATITGINLTDGGTAPTKIISNNTLSNWTGVSGTITPLNITYLNGASSCTNNTISTITNQGIITGMNIGATVNSASSFALSNNTITGLSSTGTGGAVTGIAVSNTSVGISVSNNNINGLSSNGASLVAGITVSGANNTSLSANRIYGLSTSNAGGTVFGLNITGGSTVNIFNNAISGLTASTASGNDVIRGISISSTATATYGVYFNSIYLNASSSGTNFGTTGIFHQASGTSATATLDLRNNIIVNESTPAGTGFTVAFRRSGTALNNYGGNSNRNLFYAGTPGAARLIMYDGTTSYQTMTAFQTAVATRDAMSFTGEAAFTGAGYGSAGNFFISLTGSSSDFLRPVAGITTQVESGAITISSPSITTDFTGTARSSTPDIGAYEFVGITPAPSITLNSVTPPTTAQCTATARLVSVNITTVSGTITGATLNYSVNGVAQTGIVMTNPSGSTWTGTIPVPTPANATITWSVVASNSIPLTSTYTGTSYADEPLFGTISAASASASVVCSGNPSSLSATLTKSGTVQVGTATTTTSTDGITPFTSNWEGSRRQYLVRASELQALGLGAGNITSMAFIVTAAGSGTFPQSNYTIKMGHTSANAMASAYVTPTGAFTTVFTAASEPAPAVGTRTYNFGTPFNWDGVSNVLIDICHDNDISNSCASCFSGNSTVQYSVTAFNSVWGSFADNVQGCGVQAGTTITTFNNRPNMIFAGTVATPITSVTWMDGAATVGTGNPLVVNPTTTTTYTANITALGCVASPAPTTTVTVNPLPTAPTGTNSAQCGTQVPTASVTSTTGLPTPTFKWYDAAVAGTLLQSSTSNTYTSNVATTTTFYVSELNSVTGCESGRTAVTVTVAAADGILASVDNATICIGSSINLTASNTNPTPNQSYTYTWTGTAGSGLSSQGGTPIMVTPTVPGTYTYNLSGVDGLCNAVSSVNVTVNPFTSTVTAVNVTCNGYNNGTFTQGAVTCGTGPYTYSVDGGAFGAIPTNLAPGTYAVVTKNSAGFTSAAQNITITQPSTTIATPTGTNGTVCQNGTTANVSATSNTNTTSPQSVVVTFNVAAQPAEVSSSTVPATVAASPNVVATATMAALPAGAVITGGTLNYNNLQAIGSSWMSDIRLGLTGPVTQNWTAGTGSANNAGTFNYVSTIPAGSINAAGGTITLHYFDYFSDNAGAEATFPTGAGVASITINYTVPVPAAISWWDNASGGTQIGTGSPFNAVGTSVLPNTATPGTYTLYAQGDFGGCSGLTRTAVTVTVNALPTVGAGTDQTVCSGSSVTLNGSGATSYTWNNGVTNGTPFSATATTTYTVTGTDGNGCQNTDQVLVTVNALPTVNAGADFALCTGASATLTGSGTATGYTWNNGVTDGVAFTPASTLTYTVTGTDGNGCQNTDAVVVTVNALPTVSAGADQAICSGASATLSGSGATSYSWDNGVTNGVAFTPASTLTYTVTGTDGNGCQNTDAVVVTVNTLPTVSAGVDQTVCSGTSVTVNGSGATSYSWDNGVTDGTPFAATATTTYTVTGTDGNGCQNTDAMTVTVNALPAVSAGVDQTVCSGTSVTLTGSGATSYSWDNGVTDGVSFTATATTTYTVTGTDGNGCQNTDAVTVTVNALPTVDAGADQTSCSGSSVTLSGSGATSYSWDNGVTDGVAFIPASTLTYTVTGTDANGCQNTDAVTVTVGSLPTVDAGSDQTVCFGTSVTLNGAGAISYTWDNGVTDGTPFSASATTTYTVTGTDANGCQNTDAVTVTVNALPTVNAGVDQVTCVGSPVTLTGTGTATGYTWDNGVTNGVPFAATTTTTYTVTGTDGNGCQNTDAVVVTVNALPTATATDNGDATITASAGTTYQWIDCGTGNPVAGATAQTFAPVANGSYAVVVENASGCSDTSSCVLIDYIGIEETASVNISVFPNPTHNEVTVVMSASAATIEVVDAQGKLLQVTQVISGGKVDLSAYETGVYFLRIKTENGSVLERIVKN